mgnify:CR=1 FL=1
MTYEEFLKRLAQCKTGSAADFAVEFAECDQRAGEGYGADEDKKCCINGSRIWEQISPAHE